MADVAELLGQGAKGHLAEDLANMEQYNKLQQANARNRMQSSYYGASLQQRQRDADIERALKEKELEYKRPKSAAELVAEAKGMMGGLIPPGTVIDTGGIKMPIGRPPMKSVYDIDKNRQLVEVGQIPEGGELIPSKFRETDVAQLPPSRQVRKDKVTDEIYETVGRNNTHRENISLALKAAQGIEGGLYGKTKQQILERFAPGSPELSSWQGLKDILTDVTLTKTAQTKGAISDAEMNLFRNAVANNDFYSLPQIKPTLEKFIRGINSIEQAKKNAYKRNYGEDPDTWEDLASNAKDYEALTGRGQSMSFASEQEAEKANLPKGTIVIINGKRARVR